MRKNNITIVLTCILFATQATCKQQITVPHKDALTIGKKIWRNECAGSVIGLTSWNKGEQFASLGIGHFIWLPKNCTAPYCETFPDLLQFFKRNNITLPTWLDSEAKQPCPWNSRDAFIKDQQCPRMKQLRALLTNTIELQTQFIVERMERALPTMLKAAPRKKRAHIKRNFYQVAQHPNGLYALIDYINFKGEGTNPKERCQNKGWGLLHVLQDMPAKSDNVLDNFAQSAKKMLSQRVALSPNKQQEQRFLPGWLNRIQTYRN